MIEDVEDRLLDVPMGAALLQPLGPFVGPRALAPLRPPVGAGRGAPRVGTVWTVGIGGGGVVVRETVTVLEAGVGETPLLVDAAPSVGVMRWIEGVGDEVGELLVTSGSTLESGPGPVVEPPLLDGKSVPTGELSLLDALGDSVGELVASGRSPTS